MYRYMQGCVQDYSRGGGVEEVKTDKQVMLSLLVPRAPPPDPRLCQPIAGIYLSGALSPLNFDNPKRSKIWYDYPPRSRQNLGNRFLDIFIYV